MLTVIRPLLGEEDRKKRCDQVVDHAVSGIPHRIIETAKELEETDVRGDKILFVVVLGRRGLNFEYYHMLEVIRTDRLKRRFGGCVGGIIVDGAGELYTKALARELAFAANRAGLCFPGKALVEGTGSLYNFDTMGRLLGKNYLEAYMHMAKELVRKLYDFSWPSIPVNKRNLLVVHAGNRATSNSLMIWDKVTKELPGEVSVKEIGIKNGEIIDCRGCKFETCLHFGEDGKCFYGGVIVDQIYPALLEADSVVLICPNYNDSVSANIMAFINRLTALFRTNDFSAKRFYAVVVSGYSGGDLVAQQIIGAMNFNKNFCLPPDFALIETANAPGSVLNLEGIEKRSGDFAKRMLKEMF